MSGNPFGFELAGLGHQVNDEPLRPWEWPVSEDDLYVPVDSTRAAFEEFKAVYSGPRSSAEQGRLITVIGESGCGKTSLAARCAHWLERVHLPSESRRGTIINLAGESVGDVPERRFSTVYEYIVLELRDQLHIDAEEFDRLREYRDNPLMGYRILDAHLGVMTAIVLLPPTRVPGEIPRYYGLIRNRRNIVFFAESGDAQVDEECLTVLGSQPMHHALRLGPLRPDDAWHFATSRLALHDHRQIAFDTDQQELQSMLRGIPALTSLRTLQRFFFRVFQQALKEGRSQITYSDLQNFWNLNSTFADVDLRR